MSLRDEIIEVVKNEMGVESVTSEMTFAELGMDSLDLMCIITELQLRIGPLPKLEAVKMESVGGILSWYKA